MPPPPVSKSNRAVPKHKQHGAQLHPPLPCFPTPWPLGPHVDHATCSCRPPTCDKRGMQRLPRSAQTVDALWTPAFRPISAIPNHRITPICLHAPYHTLLSLVPLSAFPAFPNPTRKAIPSSHSQHSQTQPPKPFPRPIPGIPKPLCITPICLHMPHTIHLCPPPHSQHSQSQSHSLVPFPALAYQCAPAPPACMPHTTPVPCASSASHAYSPSIPHPTDVPLHPTSGELQQRSLRTLDSSCCYNADVQPAASSAAPRAAVYFPLPHMTSRHHVPDLHLGASPAQLVYRIRFPIGVS